MEETQNEFIRKADKPRFYVDAQPNDTAAYQRAIATALVIAQGELSSKIAKGSIQKIILLTPQKGDASHGMLDNVFSSKEIDQILKGGFKRDDWPLIKAEPYTTYSKGVGSTGGTAAEIIVSFGVDSNTLFDVEHYASVAAVIGITWFAQQLDEWLKTWNPDELQKKAPTFVPYPYPSCVTQVAMKRLTDYLDPSKGLDAPREQEQASIYFTTLHKYDTPLDPAIIGAYLISKLNWRAKKAHEAETILTRLNGGRKPKGGKAEKSRYESWLEECK